MLLTNLQILCYSIYVDFRTDVRQAHTNLSVNMMPNDLPTDAICSTGISAPALIRIILVTSGCEDYGYKINLLAFTDEARVRDNYALLTKFYYRMTSWLHYLGNGSINNNGRGFAQVIQQVLVFSNFSGSWQQYVRHARLPRVSIMNSNRIN